MDRAGSQPSNKPYIVKIECWKYADVVLNAGISDTITNIGPSLV